MRSSKRSSQPRDGENPRTDAAGSATPGPDGLVLTATERGTRLEVFVKPRASKTKVSGVRAGALVVSLAAAPVDGAANAELVSALSSLLGVRKADVVIATGAASRTKILEVAGLDPAALRERLVAVGE